MYKIRQRIHALTLLGVTSADSDAWLGAIPLRCNRIAYQSPV